MVMGRAFVGAMRARGTDNQKKVGVESSRVEGEGVSPCRVVARWVASGRRRGGIARGADRPSVPPGVRSGSSQVGLVALASGFGVGARNPMGAMAASPAAGGATTQRGLPVPDKDVLHCCIQNCSFVFSCSPAGPELRAPESWKPGWNMPPACL